jgi:ABC-type nitrate/sulfonate/bicarbonate transport system ATPase subunit
MRTTSEAPVAEPQSVKRTAKAANGSAASADRSRNDSAAAVDVSHLSHSFGELAVIERLDVRVAPGEVLGIVGPSGCGKSTLLELVSGLREQSAGEIAVDGETIAADRLRSCAYMPQRDLLLPWLSAIDNAAIALRNRGISRSESRRLAHPLFERFGLAGFEGTRPTELSGGMRQRIGFLRTLLAGKPVLLLDEPFASLDAITRGEMQEWLAGALAAESRTALLVSHDVEEALYLSDRVLVLSPRPARWVTEIAAPAPRSQPRLEAVTAPAFTAARERALEALTEGRR